MNTVLKKDNTSDCIGRFIEEKKYCFLSGSVLKILALLTMLIDHIAAVLLREMSFANKPIFPALSKSTTLYWGCRIIGRLAFPIYCFLITEGYIHTHDRKKYGINLFVFAVISEIPWNLEHTGKFFFPSQNVFFTLFLGYLSICAYEKYKDNMSGLFMSLMILFAVSVLLRADYGSRGLGFILFLYIMRDKKVLQAIVGSCFFSLSWAIIVAFIPINMYSGKRGFIHGRAAKYVFYAAYPLHILLLYFLKKKYFGY